MIVTDKNVEYSLDDHFYYYTKTGISKVLGYDIFLTLDFIETDADVVVYSKQMSRTIMSKIKSNFPRTPGRKESQHRHHIPYLISEDTNDERADFLDLVAEYMRSDIEFGNDAIQNKGIVKGQVLTIEQKQSIKYSTTWHDIFNSSRLSSKFTFLISSDKFEVGY